MASVRQAISHLPEVLGIEENESELEAERDKALCQLRSMIVKRWVELERMWMKMKTRTEIDETISEFRASLDDLKAVHGDHLPFPPLFCEEATQVLVDQLMKMRPESESAGTASEKSSASSSMVPHAFRFLVNDKSTWTVLKAFCPRGGRERGTPNLGGGAVTRLR